MTENKETQINEEAVDNIQVTADAEDNTPENKPKGVLRKGGMYSGLKISAKTANIASIIAIAILVVVFIYAIATADGYTISFDSNGGTDVESIQVEYGVYGEIDAVPTREGYTFGGWYFDEALSNEYDPEIIIDIDLTLYAKWVANE